MIKINLASRKRSAGVEGKTRSSLFSRGGASNIAQSLPVRSLIIYTVMGLAIQYFVSDAINSETATLQAEVDKFQKEQGALNNDISKLAGAEQIKKAIENDEKQIRLKMETIQKLLDARTLPPKIMLSLSQIIPKDVWLTSFTLKGGDASFRGSSLGIASVSDFMRALETSEYFKEVSLKNSRQEKRNNTEVEVATFELEAKRR